MQRGTHIGGLPTHCPRCGSELAATTKPGGARVLRVDCVMVLGVHEETREPSYCGFQADAGPSREQTAMSVPRARRSAGGDE